MLTTATQQRNSQDNLQGNSQGNPQSETPPISIETSPIAPIIDAARIFSLRFTARMKRIGVILIMSILMVFLAACGGGGGVPPGGETTSSIGVLNLKVFPNATNATLTWSNPNANITKISIIYRNTTADSVERQINITAITDSNSTRRSANVTKVIPGLTNGTNYVFNVLLELGGADGNETVNRELSMTRLIGPNLDRDEYADADPRELDEDGDGTNDDIDAFPRNDDLSTFIVSGLTATPGDENVTLSWNNPAAQIASIDISYKRTGTNDELRTRISDQTTSGAADAQETITELTNGQYYTFAVSLTLTGTDENKSTSAIEITRLIGPNLDGDEYADDDPRELDEDGDGTDDDIDAFRRDPTEDTDTDLDGVGDNADAFPNDPTESMDTDGDGIGNNADAFPTDGALSAFAVTELTATPGAGNVTLNWNNPDNLVVQIASIDISYKRTGTNDAPMTISSSQTTSGAQNVKETITGLTNGQSYTFTVGLTLMDPDAGMVGPAPSISATPDVLSVTELYGVAGDSYVTLGWNNPDAQIESISISYRVSGTNNPRVTATITDSPKIDANETVQHNISGLTPNAYYDFTVSLILSVPDAGREGAPPSIRNILVNADYDNDGENNFVDVDADGDGLIEIATAQQLDQMRHNLQVSNFTRSAGGVGDANGCGNGTMEGEDVTACNGYELIANIYLTTYANWQPIGSCMNYNSLAGECSPTTEFLNAIFDGNNHTINDLTITNPAGSYDNAAGLFGAISSDSILRNIHIRSGNLSDGGRNVGLLVGYAEGGAMIINSSAEGAVDASGDNVGGLVGDGSGGATITSSYAAGGSISGANNVGGLVGYGASATITSSYVAGGAVSGLSDVGGLVGEGGESMTITSSYAAGGAVSGINDWVGGLVGDGSFSTITSSYAAGGDVSGDNSVGGLVGYGQRAVITSSYAAGGSVSGDGFQVGGLVGDGAFATITSSYAAGGSVIGDVGVGGLVGDGQPNGVTASYWDSEKSGQSSSSGGGEGKTTQELKAGADDIYSTWASDMCADGTTLTWNFGTASEYPALNCTPNGFLPQRRQR